MFQDIFPKSRICLFCRFFFNFFFHFAYQTQFPLLLPHPYPLLRVGKAYLGESEKASMPSWGRTKAFSPESRLSLDSPLGIGSKKPVHATGIRPVITLIFVNGNLRPRNSLFLGNLEACRVWALMVSSLCSYNVRAVDDWRSSDITGRCSLLFAEVVFVLLPQQ